MKAECHNRLRSPFFEKIIVGNLSRLKEGFNGKRCLDEDLLRFRGLNNLWTGGEASAANPGLRVSCEVAHSRIIVKAKTFQFQIGLF